MARLSKIKTIDNLDGILNSDPAAILTWLSIDNRASQWRHFNPENATLKIVAETIENYRVYRGGEFPSYVHWKIKNTEWLPDRENRKVETRLCMYGERALEKILPIPADFQHHFLKSMILTV